MNSINLGNGEIPVLGSPYTQKDLLEFKSKYDKFIVRENSTGRLRLIDEVIRNDRIFIDFGIRSMVSVITGIIILYLVINTKNKISNFSLFKMDDEKIKTFLDDLDKYNGSTSKTIHI